MKDFVGLGIGFGFSMASSIDFFLPRVCRSEFNRAYEGSKFYALQTLITGGTRPLGLSWLGTLFRTLSVPNICSEHVFGTLSQNHPQDHQNHLQDHQKHTYKEPPKGGCAPLGGLLIGVLLMVLEVVLVVLGVVLRQCSEQMFGTDSVRNSVPSQLS